ncbi:PRC-barrel domain containing protein [Burkholderia sp. Bp8963]|uniref:PRC-barrel domain-containing protein n=1 Tax=Burkholderia sp. Bp8963 TaxID=2184547 RepID=UPI000F5A980E|nr:PRC-barrel domain-containing protein [Burkholderia sp. Bp8963]RQS76857.1 PRC-barrel domain containing protein [Burkholderia sp. Bp8963]
MTMSKQSREGARILGGSGRPARGPGPDVMAAGTLAGNRVFTMEGDDVGKLKDVMLDVQSGQIAYAVVSSGGLLGIGDKLLAIPWGALTLDTERKCFVLPVPTERVRNAPGFAKDHWPAMADPSWAAALHEYYESSPYWLAEESETDIDAPPHEASPGGPDDDTRRH